MTDHRVTDLAYGQLGKPSYDSELGWSFSLDITLKQTIQRLLPLREYLSAPIQDASEKDGRSLRASQIARSHLKALFKAYPEAQPASSIVSAFAKTQSITELEFDVGSLFSVGRAVDVGRLSGSATPLIMGMPFGDAGHILRVIRPRIERRGWGKHGGAALPLYVTDSSDQGYYKIGAGGTIRQIIFANEDDASGTWLAVRQSTTTTIFRIVYTSSQEPTSFPGEISSIRHSNLKPSSVVTLPAKQSASTTHVDFTFNPLYSRQFAVVDPIGHWSVWDIESRHSQSSSPELVLGKSGEIYDDFLPDPSLKIPDFQLAPGWHRILWACNVTTILVCSRHHLAVFDVKSKPTRLDSTHFLVANGSDLILDIKRSAVNLNHVFVLTTSRIFWIEVSPAEKERGELGGSYGAKVLLSYRHFRDEHDENMKLATLKDDYVSVLIYSRNNHIINFYCFSTEGNTAGRCQSSQGSFILSKDAEWRKALRTAYFLPTSLTPRSSNNTSGPELQYLEGGVRFFQPWILTTDLGLSSTLCAMHTATTTNRQRGLVAPATKISRSYRRTGNRDITESFIVPDGVDEYDTPSVCHRSASSENTNGFMIDWRRIFQKAFLHPKSQSDIPTKTDMLLAGVFDRIQQGRGEDKFTMGTLLELSGLTSLTENLEKVAEELVNFLNSLQQDPESVLSLIISDLAACPAVGLPSAEDPKSPDLMKVYEQLVNKWIASLPLKVPNSARGSKFKIIRQMAVELCFSSVAISLENKLSKISIALPEEGMTLENSGEPTTRESSLATFFSSQMSAAPDGNPELTLPTPTRTPSIYSHGTSASELTEDPAVSRLRQYAISLKPRPDFGQSKLLLEWPSLPGVDPASYSYEAVQKKAAAENSGEEGNHRDKREAARRKRRTERFLQRNVEAVSQPSFLPFGSQPPEVPHPDFSSQPVEELPMTQPDRGAFGSRSVKGKKKRKKHRTAGF